MEPKGIEEHFEAHFFKSVCHVCIVFPVHIELKYYKYELTDAHLHEAEIQRQWRAERIASVEFLHVNG